MPGMKILLEKRIENAQGQESDSPWDEIYCLGVKVCDVVSLEYEEALDCIMFVNEYAKGEKLEIKITREYSSQGKLRFPSSLDAAASIMLIRGNSERVKELRKQGCDPRNLCVIRIK